MFCSMVLNRALLGGGGYFLPPLVFWQYLLKQCEYQHETFSTLTHINLKHVD